MDIIEAMRQRRSVRTFDGAPLPAEDRKLLLAFAAGLSCEFGPVPTVRIKEFNLQSGFRPGTYGMIKGAADFFMLGYGDGDRELLAAGYCFEKVVLKAWQLGYGTCWIAATFKGTDFETAEAWPEGTALRIVSPVGVAEKPGLKERLVRFSIGSKNRKPFSELFFEDDFGKTLTEGSRFGEALEMMRLAPSSRNAQPWRAVVVGNTVHFYYAPKSGLSVLDCGIGLCHFHETERFHDRKGSFLGVKNYPAPPSNLKYLISYIAAE